MWDTFKPKDTVWYCWRLNGAVAYLRKNGDAWQIAFKTIPFHERNDDFGGPDEQEPPKSLPIIYAWGTGEEVFLHPYLSTKPYLLKVQEKIRIAPGKGVSFTVDLPPVLKFELSPELVLAEIMPFSVPQTWFGWDTMQGELGHSLSNAFLPNQPAQKETPSVLIQSTILIKNVAKTMFELEYFALYPEPLNVYVRQNRLIADTLEVEFSGMDQKTIIDSSKGRMKDYRVINTGIRTSVGETIARESVAIIKNITGLS